METPRRETLRSVTLQHIIHACARLPEDLFRELLREHRLAFAASELELDQIRPDNLLPYIDRLPEAFLDTLDALQRLATSSELLCQQKPLQAFANNSLSPIEIAVRALLYHRHIFCNALAQHNLAPLPMREFCGKEKRPLPSLQGKLEIFNATLDEALKHKAYRLKHWKERQLHHFLVTYIVDVQPCRRSPHGTVTTLILPKWHSDLIVFDERTGRLRTSTSEGPLQQLYLSAFGQLVGGDTGWFTEAKLIRLDKLLSERLLDATHGLVDVRLLELVSVEPGARGKTCIERGGDALKHLESLRQRPGKLDQLRSVTFSLQSVSDGRWRPLKLIAPDVIAVNWRADAAARRFLEARGLLMSPMGGA